MAPQTHPSSRLPPSFLSGGQRQATIARHLVRISSDQQALLNRADSWAAKLVDGNLGFVNVPATVIEQLRYFETSNVLPPGAQKPPSSNTSAPKSTVESLENGRERSRDDMELEEKGDDDEEEAGESEYDAASGVSWSSSPPPQNRQSAVQPVDLRAGQSPDGSVNGSIPLPPLSSPDNVRSPSNTKVANIVAGSSGDSKNSPHAMFQTQAPLPEIQATSSPVKSNDSAPVPRTQAQTHTSPGPARTLRRAPPASFPPSSLGQEDEIEMEIPGALSHATPPINKISARVNTSQGIVLDTPPPCGQVSINQVNHASATTRAKSTNTDRKRWKNIKFSDGPDVADLVVVSETPAAATKPSASDKMDVDRAHTSSGSLVVSTFPTVESFPVQESSIPEQASAEFPNPRVPNAVGTSSEVQAAPSAAQAQVDQIDIDLHTNDMVKTSDSLGEAASFHDGPDFRERFLLEPFKTFQSAYRSFDGSLGDFVRACVSLKSLRRERKLPVFLYDDFARVFCDDYIRYVSETDEPRPMYAMEWYVDNVSKPVYQKGVLTKDNIDRVLKMYPEEYAAIRESLGFPQSPSTTAAKRAFMAAAGHSAPLSAPRQRAGPPAGNTTRSQRTSRKSNINADVSPSPYPRRRISDRSGGSTDESFVSASETPMSGIEVSSVRKAHGRRSPLSDFASGSSAKRARTLGSTPPRPHEQRLPHAEAVPARRSSTSRAAASPPREAFREVARETGPSRAKGKAPVRYSLDGRSQAHPPAVPSASGRVSSSRQSMPPPGRHAPSVGDLAHGDEPVGDDENPDESRTAGRSRALPRSFLSRQTTAGPRTPSNNAPAGTAPRPRETSLASGSRPSSSRPAASRLPTLTQESGVSKQKKQLTRNEQYRLKLERLKAQGRLPGMAGASTPRT